MNTPAELQVHRGFWLDDVLTGVRDSFAYVPTTDDRATGHVYLHGAWASALEHSGPPLLAAVEQLLGEPMPIVAFQAYRRGAGCDWHADTPFGAQAVLSLGVTRTFGVRRPGEDPEWIRVEHGDLVVMPAGFQDSWDHCVPVEDVPGERISLVFRTPRKD